MTESVIKPVRFHAPQCNLTRPYTTHHTTHARCSPPARAQSISDIYDQGACGDCWAVGAITAATDRLCIAGHKAGNGAAVGNPRLSVEHIVGCCNVCGYGCADGFPNYAWNWLAGKKGEPYGVVTGGQYGDTSFCSAYTLPPCNHYATPNDTLRNCESGPPDKTPACPATCDNNTSYKTPFAQDVHKFASAYAVPSAEASIMQEIFEHGKCTRAVLAACMVEHII